MCGIGGIVRFDGQPVERDRLDAMRQALDHRGPDGHGYHIDGPVGLVHTRLAVLDRDTGAQPMTRGNLTVVFNGEIYNHRELRRELESRGHRFTTDHSDTEVLLHGYKHWGEKLPTHLEGMFAFALWDADKASLFMARDRSGKKPLWCSRDESRLIFGSTVAAVLAGHTPTLELNLTTTKHLGHYLAFGYTDRHALNAGIAEIPCGTSAMCDPSGRIDETRYWSPPRSPGPSSPEFLALIQAAVERRLEADVPLGCFLSGGIDSSLIAAIAQHALARQGQRLQTFSVSMPDTRYDEGPWAHRVAKHIGAEHHELRAEPDIENDLLDLIRTTGEPTADSSILPTYWLSKATREHVTVALSGDGGDELFGGYERYHALRLLHRYGRWLRWLPGGPLTGEQKSFRARLGRLVRAARHRSTSQQYASIVRLFGDDQLAALGVDTTGATPSLSDQGDVANEARLWDFHHYLPFDVLRKVDRASMAVALEVRCPFLDTHVVEAALTTPMAQLMPGGQTKALLRNIARPFLPAEIVERRKMGFAVPIGLWFRGPLKPLLRKWLLDAPALRDMGLNRDRIEQLIAEHAAGKIDHTHRLFALLTLAMWRTLFSDHP